MNRVKTVLGVIIAALSVVVALIELGEKIGVLKQLDTIVAGGDENAGWHD